MGVFEQRHLHPEYIIRHFALAQRRSYSSNRNGTNRYTGKNYSHRYQTLQAFRQGISNRQKLQVHHFGFTARIFEMASLGYLFRIQTISLQQQYDNSKKNSTFATLILNSF